MDGGRHTTMLGLGLAQDTDTGVSAHVIYPEAVGARTRMHLRASEDIDGFRPLAAGAIPTATSSMSATSTTKART